MPEIGDLNAMKERFEFLGSKPSDECGCPEEDWVIGMFNVTMHLEPVTGGDIQELALKHDLVRVEVYDPEIHLVAQGCEVLDKGDDIYCFNDAVEISTQK